VGAEIARYPGQLAGVLSGVVDPVDEGPFEGEPATVAAM